jgi:hypothetical protein
MIRFAKTESGSLDQSGAGAAQPGTSGGGPTSPPPTGMSSGASSSSSSYK